MIRQRFYIDRYRWEVWAYYNTDELDAQEILSALDYIGVSRFDYTVAEDNLMSGSTNQGLCCSNYRSRASALVISDTSSPKQFMNSLIHEIRHLERHIGQAYGIDPYSEEAAYLAGDIAEQMFPIAKRFICEHCRVRINKKH